MKTHLFSAVLLLLIRYSVPAAGSHSSAAVTNSEHLSCSRRRAVLYRLVGAGRNTVSHASPKATKKNRPPHLSAVKKRHSAASGGAAEVAGTY